MNQELEFAKKIEELRQLAKTQGNVVAKEQVEELFEEIGISSSQLTPVYDYLKSKKIGVDEQVNLDEYLTREETDYIAMYMESLEELPDYSSGEKQAHFIGAMAGEYDAKQHVIQIMLKDIVDIAKLYSGQGVLVEDLIGEGNVAVAMGVEMLGALEAADEVPATLAQMAMTAMENLIQEEMDSKKADDKIADKVNKVTDAAKELAESLNRKITVDELAAEGKLSKKMIEDAIRMSGEKIEYFEGSK